MAIAEVDETKSSQRTWGNLGSFFFSRHAIIVLVVALTALGYFVSVDTLPKIDEPYHYWQIEMFINGDWSMLKTDDSHEYPFFAMLPGYHAAVALIFGPLQIKDPAWMRVFSIVCGIGTFLLALAISRKIEGKANYLRAAQIFFSPFSFPFYFLLYSDIFSLATVLVLLFACVSSNTLTTIIASLACLLVRQSHIVLVGLLTMFAVKGALFDLQQSVPQRLVTAARTALPFLPAFAFFAVFLIWNDGRVPLCYPHLQQTSTLGWNAILFLALTSVWLAPAQVSMARETFGFIAKNKLISCIILGFVIVLISRLWIEDPRNQTSHFVELLRNYVMHFAIGSTVGYFLFACAVLWAIFSMIVSKWSHQYGRMTFGVVALTMGPIMLVEPRYFIPATSWYLLFRRHQSEAVERFQLVWLVILAFSLHWFQSVTIYLM